MRQIAQLAEQVREQRQPTAPDNPLLHVQAMISDGIIAALDGYRQVHENAVEQLFLAVYGSPVLQAMVGLGASDEPPRRRPGDDPERSAFVQQRIAEIKARVGEGGAREAVIRALVYVGMGGAGVDERTFNELRQIRAENAGMPLQAFKQTLREQYFTLLLDPQGALAAIPGMVPDDPALRARLVQALRRTVEAAGPVTGERGQRLERVETLLGGARPAARSRRTARKAA
jgi:hypothetical protein